jgi:hypothetical protein
MPSSPARSAPGRKRAHSVGERRLRTLERQGRARVRWAARCRWIELDGVSRPLPVWVKLTGIPGNVSRNRLFRGWSERDALTVPVGERVGHPARLVTYDGRTRTIDDLGPCHRPVARRDSQPAEPGLVRRGRPDRAAANQATSVLPVDTSNVACFDSLAWLKWLNHGALVVGSSRLQSAATTACLQLSGLCLAWAGRYR